MSLRPRFGDGGMLRRPAVLLPEWVAEHDYVEVVGHLSSDRDYDPFERTDSGLLLAEEFARAYLELYDDAHRWFHQHGVVDLRAFFPGESWHPYHDPEPETSQFMDGRHDVRRQQVNVAWLLRTLAHLSDGPDEWDPDWMSVVIDDQQRPIWIDVHRGRVRYRRRYAEPEPPDELALWVPTLQKEYGWSAMADGRPWLIDDEVLAPLTPDRHGLTELARRIIEPYVRIAGQFQVDMPWIRPDLPLVVRERRRWRSLLAPVYLQLLEGLRRVTEGQRGAAFCKECGEPFLSLDARRSSFCNDTHRFRFSQRERRKRVDAERAVRDAIVARDAATARVDRPGEDEVG